MIGLASYADKAAGAVAKAKATLARHTADREAHQAAKPDGSDVDALIGWKRLAADFDLRVEAAGEALEFAEAAAIAQAAKATEAEADRRHAAAQKVARASERLTLDVVAAAEKLADALAALEANRAQVDEANAVRGDRAFIVDGEAKLRRGPSREVPAVTVRDRIWVDRAGNRVPALVSTPGPPLGCEIREVETVMRAAYQVPGDMPDRLASAIRLVDLQGRQIWPRS